MTPKELKDRTKRFAVDIIRLCRDLPTTLDGRTVGQQMIRSGTSVGANYRASCRARSRAEWSAKLGTVEEESDETSFGWRSPWRPSWSPLNERKPCLRKPMN
jgi:four helix bundle protein